MKYRTTVIITAQAQIEIEAESLVDAEREAQDLAEYVSIKVTCGTWALRAPSVVWDASVKAQDVRPDDADAHEEARVTAAETENAELTAKVQAETARAERERVALKALLAEGHVRRRGYRQYALSWAYHGHEHLRNRTPSARAKIKKGVQGYGGRVMTFSDYTDKGIITLVIDGQARVYNATEIEWIELKLEKE